MDIFGLIGGILGKILMLFLKVTRNYGVAVILFTLFIKLILIPFDIKRQKSMVGMARISKKRAELEKKYSKDKMKLNEEINKLYAKEEINPLSGGCLTTFLPLFILFGVIAAVGSPLTNTFDFPQEVVRSAEDVVKNNPEIDNLSNSRYSQIEVFSAYLQRPDAFQMFSEEQVSKMNEYKDSFKFLGMNLLDVPKNSSFNSMLWLIPALCFVSSIFMTYLMQKIQAVSQPREMKGCMTVFTYASSLLSLWIAFGAPVAVGVYWLVNTLLTIIQSLFLNKVYSVELITARQEAGRIAFRLQEEANVKKV